jgi:ribosomal protein S18 acetylase RimI-like enzyme
VAAKRSEGNSMKIRKMENQDITAVEELIRRNFDEVMSKYHSINIIDDFKNHNTAEKLMNQMNWKEIFVVEINDELVATGALANFGNNEVPKYSISNFFVKPELHGQGIGRSLFNYLFEVFKGKNVKDLHVPSSRNAVKFYEKMGFVEDLEQNDIKDEITWMTRI